MCRPSFSHVCPTRRMSPTPLYGADHTRPPRYSQRAGCTPRSIPARSFTPRQFVAACSSSSKRADERHQVVSLSHWAALLPIEARRAATALAAARLAASSSTPNSPTQVYNHDIRPERVDRSAARSTVMRSASSGTASEKFHRQVASNPRGPAPPARSCRWLCRRPGGGRHVTSS